MAATVETAGMGSAGTAATAGRGENRQEREGREARRVPARGETLGAGVTRELARPMGLLETLALVGPESLGLQE
jgi:hypothetical protein